MATMTEQVAVTRRVREISDPTVDSFVLEYEDGGASEEVAFADVIAAVPAAFSEGSQSDELLLLYIENPGDPAATTEGDAQEQPGAERFGGFLAVRQLSKACAIPLHRYIIPRLPEHLDVSQGRQFHVVVSTRSGACDAELFFERIVQPVLAHLGFPKEAERHQSYELYLTTSHHSVSDLAETVIAPQANRGVPQTLLLLSGDGGIIDTINGIYGMTQTADYIKPVVGLLALGTGNALANSAGLNDGSTRGLSSFLRGSPKAVPTFKATFSPGAELLSNEGLDAAPLVLRDSAGVGTMYGVVVASWALHASLVGDSDTAEYRKHGAARFAMAAEELLAPSDGSEPHVYRAKVLAYQRTGAGAVFPVHWERHEHMYLLATFCSNLERNLRISPRSKPLDKTMRLLHWGKLASEEVMDIFAMAYSGGKHTELDVVGYEPIEGFRIDFEESDARWRRVCIDGKIVRIAEGGWMEIRKQDPAVVELVTDAA